MKNNLFYIIALVLLFGGTAFVALGGVSFQSQAKPSGQYEYTTLLSATTTTATSTNLSGGGGYVGLVGAKHVAVYFSRDAGAGANEGSSVFNIQMSPDGSNWYDYNTLVQNLATSTDITTLGSVTLSATTTKIVYPQHLGFYALRCVVVETTDGSHTCKVGVEY